MESAEEDGEEIPMIKVNKSSKFFTRSSVEEFRKSYSYYFHKINQKTTTILKNKPKFDHNTQLYYRSVRFFCCEKYNGCNFQISLNLAKSGDCLEIIKSEKLQYRHNHPINVS